MSPHLHDEVHMFPTLINLFHHIFQGLSPVFGEILWFRMVPMAFFGSRWPHGAIHGAFHGGTGRRGTEERDARGHAAPLRAHLLQLLLASFGTQAPGLVVLEESTEIRRRFGGDHGITTILSIVYIYIYNGILRDIFYSIIYYHEYILLYLWNLWRYAII